MLIDKVIHLGTTTSNWYDLVTLLSNIMRRDFLQYTVYVSFQGLECTCKTEEIPLLIG